MWLAQQDEPVKRLVALKIIKAGMDTKEVIARFESERQALAVMDHPNIARVLDAGAADTGRPYFVMEHVKGIPITDFCDQNKTSPEKRLDLFCDTCRAVQHAHRKGIIHRDIKPTNILVALDNDVPIVKVIDFGLAKATGARLTEKTLFTSIGKMVGTPAYMSPEQAGAGVLDVDTRTDVYSLGVLLYELLTGVTPFDVAHLEQAGYAEMQRIIRDDNPPTPSTRLSSANGDSAVVAARCAMDVQGLVKMLRGDLDVIVMKSLEKDRSRRYGSPSEFAADVRRFLNHEPIEARKASTFYRIGRMYQRNKAYFVGVGLLAASILIGAVASVVFAIRAIRAENLASDSLDKLAAEHEKLEIALSDSESARSSAEAARAKAEEVSQLLVEIFESPDPSRDGSAITIVEMLDRAAERLQTELADQPDRQAELKLVIAKTYNALRLNEKAAPLAEQVLDYRLSRCGPEDEATQDAMLWLVNCLNGQNQYDKARRFAERHTQICMELYGPDDKRTLVARNALATTFWRGGNARDQADSVLAIREDLVERAQRTLGPDSPQTLALMNNLANSYVQVQRYAEALTVRESVLAGYKDHYGDDSPQVLHTLQVLVHTLRRSGDLDSALPIAKELCGLSESVLGETHASTERNLEVYSELLWSTGQRKESVAVNERLLSVRRDKQGLHGRGIHQQTIRLIERLGLAGQHEKAMLLGEEFTAGVERTFGPDHLDVVKGMSSTVQAVGGLPGADEKLLAKALEMAVELCEDEPQSAKTLHLQGIIHYRLKDYPNAIANMKKAHQRYPSGPDSRYFWAMSFWRMGESELARKQFQSASEKFARKKKLTPWDQAAHREANELIQSSDVEPAESVQPKP